VTTSSGENGHRPEAVADRLGRVRGFVFDMDGTLVLGDAGHSRLDPLPGALELLDLLHHRGVRYAVLTNGSNRTPAEYAEVLRGLGFALPDERMVTPASSAVEVLLRHGHRRVVVLGGEGVSAPLRDAGLEVVAPRGRPQADAVLVGWYRDFTQDRLESACHAVWGGAALYSASQAPFFATVGGRSIGTSLAITAMIRAVTGCRVEVVGKPSLHALRTAAGRLGLPLRELAVVGDDPALEVPMAHRGRCLAVAVGTGIGADGAYAHLPPRRRPHLSVPGAGELLDACLAAGTGTPTPPEAAGRGAPPEAAVPESAAGQVR
jgi:HAD superfamily hydrolase (TIGR01450 family)